MLFFQTSRCWWANAHAMTGAVALESLSAKEQEQLLTALNQNGLNFKSILHATSWQDDLKDISTFFAMQTWHFNDRAIIRVQNPKYFQVNKLNVESYLEDAWNSLTNPTTTDTWTFSFHLASILHFLGDIHTPHHNAALVDERFPDGDNGGTKYLLNCEMGSLCTHIHFYWDAVSNDLPGSDFLNPNRRSSFDKNVSRVLKEFPKSYFKGYDINTQNFQLWSNESYEYADKYGYPKDLDLYLKYPPESYADIVRQRSYERIAIGGYRLGAMLRYLFDTRDIPGVSKSSMSAFEICTWVFDSIMLIVIIIFSIILYKGQSTYVFLP